MRHIQFLQYLRHKSVHIFGRELFLSSPESDCESHALHRGRDRHSLIYVEQFDIAHIFARRAHLLFYLRAGDLLVHDQREVAGDVEELRQRLKCRRLSAERIQRGQIQFFDGHVGPYAGYPVLQYQVRHDQPDDHRYRAGHAGAAGLLKAKHQKGQGDPQYARVAQMGDEADHRVQRRHPDAVLNP